MQSSAVLLYWSKMFYILVASFEIHNIITWEKITIIHDIEHFTQVIGRIFFH